jgi:hypothetical protein
LSRVRFCAESEIKNSRQRRLCREQNKKLLGIEKTLGEEASLPRANKKNSRQRKKHSARISLPRAKRLALGKEIFKNHFFISGLFLSSTYTYTRLMLKFGTILTLFAIFNNFTSSRYFFRIRPI